MCAAYGTQAGLPCATVFCKHIGLSPYLYPCRDRKRHTATIDFDRPQGPSCNKHDPGDHCGDKPGHLSKLGLFLQTPP